MRGGGGRLGFRTPRRVGAPRRAARAGRAPRGEPDGGRSPGHPGADPGARGDRRHRGRRGRPGGPAPPLDRGHEDGERRPGAPGRYHRARRRPGRRDDRAGRRAGGDRVSAGGEGRDIGRDRWRATTRARALAEQAERRASFRTSSGIEARDLYIPAHIRDLDEERDLGRPGEFPFTRGVQATMYRGRLWTMRQYAGFSTAAETQKRFRYMLG